MYVPLTNSKYTTGRYIVIEYKRHHYIYQKPKLTLPNSEKCGIYLTREKDRERESERDSYTAQQYILNNYQSELQISKLTISGLLVYSL